METSRYSKQPARPAACGAGVQAAVVAASAAAAGAAAVAAAAGASAVAAAAAAAAATAASGAALQPLLDLKPPHHPSPWNPPPTHPPNSPAMPSSSTPPTPPSANWCCSCAACCACVPLPSSRVRTACRVAREPNSLPAGKAAVALACSRPHAGGGVGGFRAAAVVQSGGRGNGAAEERNTARFPPVHATPRPLQVTRILSARLSGSRGWAPRRCCRTRAASRSAGEGGGGGRVCAAGGRACSEGGGLGQPREQLKRGAGDGGGGGGRARAAAACRERVARGWRMAGCGARAGACRLHPPNSLLTQPCSSMPELPLPLSDSSLRTSSIPAKPEPWTPSAVPPRLLPPLLLLLTPGQPLCVVAPRLLPPVRAGVPQVLCQAQAGPGRRRRRICNPPRRRAGRGTCSTTASCTGRGSGMPATSGRGSGVPATSLHGNN